VTPSPATLCSASSIADGHYSTALGAREERVETLMREKRGAARALGVTLSTRR
jgi:hypothetical protein